LAGFHFQVSHASKQWGNCAQAEGHLRIFKMDEHDSRYRSADEKPLGKFLWPRFATTLFETLSPGFDFSPPRSLIWYCPMAYLAAARSPTGSTSFLKERLSEPGCPT
jgi:hypothetical protein